MSKEELIHELALRDIDINTAKEIVDDILYIINKQIAKEQAETLKYEKRYEIQIEELQKQLFNKQQDLDVLRDSKIEADIKLKKTKKALELMSKSYWGTNSAMMFCDTGIQVNSLAELLNYYLEQANKFFDRR